MYFISFPYDPINLSKKKLNTKAEYAAQEPMNLVLNYLVIFQEKTGDQKNMNHAHDFKTLADVLIQETVRHDLGKCYPNLAEHILVKKIKISK